MRRLSPDARFIALILGGLALLFSDVLFFGSGFYLRDVLRDHMPSRYVFREILLRYHELPLWNPWFSAGQPLAANPGFQAFYPGTWLVLLPDFRWGFDFAIVAHVALAAVGMFALLRELELRPESALFGAVAFSLGGAVLSFTSTLPFLAAMTWWPLIVRGVLRVLRRGTRREIALLTLPMAMMFLAAEQSVIMQTAILIVAIVIVERRNVARAPRLALACVLAFVIGGAQLFPALRLKSESGRAHDLPIAQAFAWSMPLDRPLELFWPHAHGSVSEDAAGYAGAHRYSPPRIPLVLSIYCGVAVPLLFIAGLFLRVPWRGWAASLVILSYLMAIGSNGPLMRALFAAGLFRTIRYPEKWIVFGLFAMIVFAAMVVDRLKPRVVVVIVILTAADVLVYFNEIAPRMPASFFDAPPLASTLAVTRGRSRVFWPVAWHPRLSQLLGRDANAKAEAMLIPYANALFDIASVCEIDINLTTQRRTADFVQSMWETSSRTGRFGPFLGMANAEFVVAPDRPEHPFNLVHIATRPRYEFADQIATIHSRQDFMNAMAKGGWSDRIAFVETASFLPAAGDVMRVDETPTAIDIDVRAAGRALLLIRNTPHPNWRASIDGRAAPLQPANLGFTALEVPGGAHHVALRYRDPFMAACVAVSLLALAATLLLLRERAA